MRATIINTPKKEGGRPKMVLPMPLLGVTLGVTQSGLRRVDLLVNLLFHSAGQFVPINNETQPAKVTGKDGKHSITRGPGA